MAAALKNVFNPRRLRSKSTTTMYALLWTWVKQKTTSWRGLRSRLSTIATSFNLATNLFICRISALRCRSTSNSLRTSSALRSSMTQTSEIFTHTNGTSATRELPLSIWSLASLFGMYRPMRSSQAQSPQASRLSPRPLLLLSWPSLPWTFSENNLT